MSDEVIDISFEKEANLLQIISTTTSIVNLAVWNSLAAEIMTRPYFSKENFSTLYLAGQFGRNILQNVIDVMSSKSAFAMVFPKATLR